MVEMNWELWALDMCSLLDKIEAVADDEDRVLELVHGRFAMAEGHGLTIEICEVGTAREQ